VDAVDNDPNALDIAKRNVKHYELQDQIQLIQSDLFTALGDKQYDLIVSNPPYVSDKEIESLAPEFKHEPKQGLLGEGQDGLAVVQKILQQAGKHLSPGGILVCEVGNSDASLIARYPHVPFTWIEFERGGQGVFVLTADQLKEYQDQW
jgi:ribosomal protein L3 glutamine methyltransferase